MVEWVEKLSGKHINDFENKARTKTFIQSYEQDDTGNIPLYIKNISYNAGNKTMSITIKNLANYEVSLYDYFVNNSKLGGAIETNNTDYGKFTNLYELVITLPQEILGNQEMTYESNLGGGNLEELLITGYRITLLTSLSNKTKIEYINKNEGRVYILM